MAAPMAKQDVYKLVDLEQGITQAIRGVGTVFYDENCAWHSDLFGVHAALGKSLAG
jgi:hypothetical protein